MSAYSYLDWVTSQQFQLAFQQHVQVGGSAASLIFTRQDAVFPDPPTSDVTLQLLRRGRDRFSLDFGAGRFEPVVRPGDLLIAPDLVPLGFEGEGRVEVLTLAMHGGRLREAIGAALGRRDVDLTGLHTRAHRDPQITTALHWLWEEAQVGTPNGRLYADGVLAIITSRLAGMIGRTPGAAGALPRWQVDRITDHLQADVSAQVALADLAALVGLSEAHFCRSFKRATGLSPLQWQLAMRIDHAKVLLAQPRTPMAEVAAAYGYAQPAHFAKLFRRATGVAPSEWRRQRLA
jgi:AraC family transcriptional regulator